MEGLEEARSLLHSNYYKGSCVGYVVLDSDGKSRLGNHTACYGGIGGVITTKSIAILNQIQTKYYGYFKSLPKGTAKKYLNWLVNESVYKDVFIEKDVNTILKNGDWSVNTNFPGNIVVSAMTVARALTEGDRGCRSVKYFLNLTEAGVSPEFSFILGHYFGSDGRLVSGYDSHHCAISKDYITTECVANFCKKLFAKPRDDIFTKDRRYDGVQTLFDSDEKSPKFFTWLLDTYKLLNPSTVPIHVKNDPFSSKATEVVEADFKDVKIWVEVYEQFKKEFL